MLHNCHELNDIVPQFRNPWQRVPCKLLVRPDTGLGGRDTNMSFVNFHTFRLRWPLVLESVCFGRVPEPGVVNWRNGKILSDALDPGWETLDSLAGREYQRDLSHTYESDSPKSR